MPRRPLIHHVDQPRTVAILLNRKHELVQRGVDLVDKDLAAQTLAVLRSGGQLLRVPRDVAAGLREWQRIDVLQLGVTQPTPSTAPATTIPIPADAGSPFD